MRLGVLAETPLEWLALRAGRIPTPLVETHLAFVWARTLMVATRVGVFEALGDGAADAAAVAAACGTSPGPTRRLLDALTGMGYLRPAAGRGEGYALGPVARRWLLRRSRHEVVDKVLFSFDEWRFVEGYDAYVRDGVHVDMHARLADADLSSGPPPAGAGVPEATSGPPGAPAGTAGASAHDAAREPDTGWHRYLRGLGALAKLSVDEVARRTPVPPRATELLDVGGGHGAFAAALVRRHPRLRATILDLDHAVDASAPAVDAHGLGERLRHRRGDALTVDLGSERFDVVFASQFTHHLDEAANVDLAARIARALRPGGTYVVQDLVRPRTPREAQRARLGAVLDLYFAVTSGAGTVTIDTLQAWQRGAGLEPRPPVWMRTLPGMVQQVATKPARATAG